MAVSGDLKNINLGDIFQTLSMNRQVGLLVVRDGTREKRIFFSEDGVSLGATVSTNATRLGSYLVGEGLVTNAQLLEALARQKEWGGLLGDHIVRMELCSQEAVDESIRYQAAGQLYDVFFWEEGRFEFIERPTPAPADAASPYASVRFDPNGVVMEAARRIDEWDLVRTVFPDPREILVATGEEPPTHESAGWSATHRTLLKLLDGTRDITALFEQFHLSPFDTGAVLRELFEWGLVRACTTEELLDTARAFTEARDPAKAIRCLERAHDRDPANQRALELLSYCYEAVDERRSASRALYELGKLREFTGEVGPAVNALEKAARFDPRLPDPNILLMRIYRDLGDSDASARCANAAAEILMDAEQFQRSVEICREALRENPRETGLRFRLVNSLLGMGLQDNAVAELENIAAAFEDAKSYRNAEEVYRKILQLDPSRVEYLNRLNRLQSRAATRRRRFHRLAIACASVVVLLFLSLLLFSPQSSAKDLLASAWTLFEQGDSQGASKLAEEIIEREPGSENAIEARNLLVAITHRRNGREGPRAAARQHLGDELEKRFTNAEEGFRSAEPLRGFDSLRPLAEYLESKEFRDTSRLIGSGETAKMVDEYRNSVKALVRDYAQAIEHRTGEIRTRIGPLLEKSLPRDSLEALKALCATLEGYRPAGDRQTRPQILSAIEDVKEVLLPGDSRIAARLTSVIQNLTDVEDDADRLFHSANALVIKRELFEDFPGVVRNVKDLNYQGKLLQSRDLCRSYLLRCDQLKHMRPAIPYESAATQLFDDKRHDIDGQMQQELQRVEEVLDGIRQGKTLIDAGHLEEANAHHRDLVARNYRIDLSDHIVMVLLLKTNPTGAEILSQWQDQPATPRGVTTPDGLIVTYPPYGTTRFFIRKDSFEAIEFVLSGFADEYPTRSSFSLRKRPEWKASGGSVQGEPAFWNGNVVVPSRDGHLRVYAADTGELSQDHDTALLTGLTYAPVIQGDTCFTCTPGREVIAMDLARKSQLWTFRTGAPMTVGPVLASEVLIIADQDGTVYGVRGGEAVWRRELLGRIRATPATGPGAVYFATTEGVVYRIEPNSGEIAWEKHLDGPVYAPLGTAGEDLVLMFQEPATLLALGPDGEIRWTFATGGPVAGRPSASEGYVDIATISGTVHRLSAATGKELHQMKAGGGQKFRSGTVSRGDMIYLVSTLGRLFAISAAEGTQWTYDLGEAVSSPPLLRGDRLFTVTNSGMLFGFQIPTE